MLNQRDLILAKAVRNFSLPHIELFLQLQSLIEEEHTILDLGCGVKHFTLFLRCKELVGMDVHSDYVTKKDVCGDIRDLNIFFPDNSFDVVLALDVIEHLEKEEGEKLIENMLKVCKKKIVIFTPKKWSENKHNIENKDLWSYGNIYNLHKSLWYLDEFIKKGFIELESPFKNNYIFVVREKG